MPVDFCEIDFVAPGPALLLASALRQRSVVPRISDAAAGFGYAAQIGFFDACGLGGVGRGVGDAPGGLNYAPICALSCRNLRERAWELRSSVPELLQTNAGNLARILSRSVSGPINVAITYAMREIMRNVVEHSGAEQIWYTGQYWESSRMVEVAVLDEGVGFRATLSRNPDENGQIDSEEAAIRLALQPAVSGVPRGQRGQTQFDNTGYGLYITRRLGQIGSGTFAAVSNEGALSISATKEAAFTSAFRGTLIQLRLDVSDLGDVEKLVERIAKEGEEERDSLSGLRLAASRASRSVSV